MPYHVNIPNITIAFHGCDRAVGERILQNESFKPSENDYDWLGPGIYFWESNPKRALSFIKEQMTRRSEIKDPFVVGAALSLGNCIDTLSENCLEGIEKAFNKFKYLTETVGRPMPLNKGGKDLLMRELDCKVVQTLHAMMEDEGQPRADSLRGLYNEGGELYPGSGFYKKSHIQICIATSECIKGVFRVKSTDLV